MARPGAVGTLQEVGSGGVRHHLDGKKVSDGDLLEVSTASGWVSGHYRALLHPESGAVGFEMHVACDGGALEHVTLFLPPDALLRWPTPERSAALGGNLGYRRL